MTTMVQSPTVARTREKLAAARAALGGTVVYVPTMGALHEGHRTLIRRARELGDSVAVSIFVNLLQFGPAEDFDQYPRTFQSDLAMCREEGVVLVFAPPTGVVYPDQPLVTVHAGPMGGVLEGASRPGHFDGVLTVVLKLFHLVRPDVAVFGEKDAQQLALIRRMVADLDVGVRIVGVPTVRDPDGLALSSRNRYLSPRERVTALVLNRALRLGRAATPSGPEAVRCMARAAFGAAAVADPPFTLDYLVLVDPNTLADVAEDFRGQAVLAVAGWIGTTRLIDNVTVTFEEG